MNKYELYISSIPNPLFKFTNQDIVSIDRISTVDLVSEELTIDELTPHTFYVQYLGNAYTPLDYDLVETSDGYIYCDNQIFNNLRTVPYGTPAWLYKNDRLVGKYYINNVQRTSKVEYQINCVSAIGLLDSQKHYGGLYSGQTFEDVANEIIGGLIPFSCEEDVKNTTVYGWLPYASKRENLHQLMFATSAVLTKDADGDIRFSYIYSSTPEELSDGKVYVGGDIDYGSPASDVNVTEHSFVKLPTDIETVLFDNTTTGEAADNLLVTFRDAPIYDINVNGTPITTVPVTIDSLTVHELGVNYIKISGGGTVSGKPYTHLTHIVEKSVSTNAERKTVTASECTLVTALNSENVANRLMSYYSSKKVVRCDIETDEESCGRNIKFTDPYGDSEQGYIYKMRVVSSGNEKATCEVVTDYTPQGQGNAYTEGVMKTGSGTWIIPSSVFQKDIPTIKCILIGGGNGGGSGGCGKPGTGSGMSSSYWTEQGGDGGVAGIAGNGGKIRVEVIDVTGVSSISYNCGLGGAGGVCVQGNYESIPGGDGTDTVVSVGARSYSSSGGASMLNGYQNIFTGEVYGVAGADDGVPGGHGHWEGSNVQYEGVTYSVGARGNSASADGQYAYGGGGGGPAVGSNGGNGGNAEDTGEYTIANGQRIRMVNGGSGGRGANAQNRSHAINYGNGGDAGHGGGGGAGGGYSSTSVFEWGGSGAGGLGGNGGNGANGCLIIYY